MTYLRVWEWAPHVLPTWVITEPFNVPGSVQQGL